MKRRHAPDEAEIPGWDQVAEALTDLVDLEPPAYLATNIMAAVSALPIPRRLEPVPEDHRADLGRTLFLFAAVLAAGGLLCAYLAPGLFFAFGAGLWYLVQATFAVLLGLGSGLNLLLDACADKLWTAAPLVGVVIVVAVLALEWRVLSRVLAGRVATDV